MPATEYVRARIDSNIKEEAANVLAGLGLTVSDACRMMLTKIAYDGCLPFGTTPTARKPKERTLKTIQQVDRGEDLHRCKDLDDFYRQLDS